MLVLLAAVGVTAARGWWAVALVAAAAAVGAGQLSVISVFRDHILEYRVTESPTDPTPEPTEPTDDREDKSAGGDRTWPPPLERKDVPL